MRTVFTVLLVALFSVSAFSQVTPIRDIQFTQDASGDSPLLDQMVTISGIITAEAYAFGGSKYWVQDANEPWSGIMVYDRDNKAAEGDSVTLTGTVTEYYNLTEIVDVTEFTLEEEGVFGIQPLVVTSGVLNTDAGDAEQYEGCLVKVDNANITEAANNYGEWKVDDGSGVCVVDSDASYYFDSSAYSMVQSVTGVVDFAFGIYKIQPRLAMDVVEEGPYTRFQRIQQVRHSDLIKSGVDALADTSYYRGDTLSVKGVVTMPTGLSYAGEGVKFIVGDPNGGPWSAVLSYNPDSTAYPSLFEGDEITMTGWIDEYQTGPSNMTEFWITSPINITNFGQPVPEADSIKTGDLLWPTTAEQWGNVMVQVNEAKVTDVDPQYMLFAVDDGTGEALVDDDSDSLTGYQDPPIGTEAKMIRGWIYHHYGSYADSTAYQICPLYPSDFVWGAGPPAVTQSHREKAYCSSSETMKVMTTVQTSGELASVSVYYKIDDGEYSEMEMFLADGTWSADIPAQPAGSFVSYYFKATDTAEQSTTDPADVENRNFCYIVKDSDVTIKDIQYSPWPIADSPFEGYEVEVEGVVTADTSYYNNFEAYVIQDEDGAWNGVYVFGSSLPALTRGDKVKVKGVVTDHNEDWLFKWENNTVILAESAEVMESVDEIAAVEVETGALASDTTSAEQWEGSLVRVNNVTLTSINSYDVSVSDGSGECLLDADGFVGTDQDPNPFFFIDGDNEQLILNNSDTLKVGDTISMAQGVFTFSFGTFKIEVRDLADMGIVSHVDSDIVAAPLTYELKQNFPNPFNPETRIYFTIPETQKVQLVVYNVMGQQVRRLVDTSYQAGHHVINWDGRNQAGDLVPTGVYFYRIKAGDFIDYKKMTLMK